MKFLNQLDDLVKKVVAETFATSERQLQNKQSAEVDKLGLRASKKKKKKSSSKDEADDEEPKEKKDEKPPEEEKIKGDPEEVVKGSKKDKEKDGKGEDAKGETPGTQSSKKLRDPTPQELEQPDFGAIANNINLLRGGKSLKDKEVRSNLKSYIEKLSSSEKKNVLIYLNSLAQVLAGVKKGSEASGTGDVEKQVKKAKKQPSGQPQKEVGKESKPTPSTSTQGVIVVGK